MPLPSVRPRLPPGTHGRPPRPPRRFSSPTPRLPRWPSPARLPRAPLRSLGIYSARFRGGRLAPRARSRTSSSFPPPTPASQVSGPPPHPALPAPSCSDGRKHPPPQGESARKRTQKNRLWRTRSAPFACGLC
ncbi:hypothetical protein GQ55_7G100600 [Panicum hallii var. hallii]|uniref:Uncharacterized protein n=1 Tax=Panicum hallii var. hallii TaxID=1504633 RepID=A0A2T7CTJ5_9POAL|nr:hypothetical protein GQ55_7G100600 [Panicum hallii var. hallii]